MKAAAVPTVFIVDDDGGVRRAVQDLVESVGLRRVLCDWPRVSKQEADLRPELPGSGRKAA